VDGIDLLSCPMAYFEISVAETSAPVTTEAVNRLNTCCDITETCFVFRNTDNFIGIQKALWMLSIETNQTAAD
jgi:hypothetical protein